MFYRKFLSLILLLTITQVTCAKSIEELIKSGELEAKVEVETSAPLFQKAPIVIAVKIGTSNRFSKSTRVRNFTVAGALVRPNSKFAFNETIRKGNDSWAFQS